MPKETEIAKLRALYYSLNDGEKDRLLACVKAHLRPDQKRAAHSLERLSDPHPAQSRE
jgi:hypothetical protein